MITARSDGDEAARREAEEARRAHVSRRSAMRRQVAQLRRQMRADARERGHKLGRFRHLTAKCKRCGNAGAESCHG